MVRSRKKSRKKHHLFHRPPAGSSPGTVLPPLNPQPTQVRMLAYSPEEVISHDELDPLKFRAFRQSHPVTWVSIHGLSDVPRLQKLCEELGLHRLTVEDIFNQGERPKSEYYDHYDYVSIHIPRSEERSETEMISLVIGHGFVVSFQNTGIESLEGIRNRIVKKIGQIRMKGSDYLAYAMIDAVIDLYFPIAEHYAQKLDLVEEEIINTPRATAVFDIYKMRSRLNYLHRVLRSHQELLSQLMRDPESPFGDDACIYLRDCQDHAIQIIEFLDNLKDTSKTLIDLHLSLQTHRSNEIVKFLTIITAIFIPMTFITGLYGMNFNTSSPWNMPELNWIYGYPFAIVLMLCAAGSLLLYFYRQKWFAISPSTLVDIDEDK